MAANYWVSSQRLHWHFTKEKLAEIRAALELEDQAFVQQFNLPERRLLSEYFRTQITKLARRLPQQIRQQAIATAQIYLRRFYTKVEIRRTNVFLMLATALYLACKMEECPQHIRSIASEARNIWPEFITPDTARIGEYEFLLISEMSSHLIIHHPYRTLLDLQTPLTLSAEEFSLSWSIVNDHYVTDLPLLYPPHVIAVTAIFLALVLGKAGGGGTSGGGGGGGSVAGAVVQSVNAAAVLANAAASLKSDSGGGPISTFTLPPSGSKPLASILLPADVAALSLNPTHLTRIQSFVSWLAKGEVDIKAMVECTQEIVSLYEVLEGYSEKLIRDAVGIFVRGRGLDK
ncbi:MAG: RNA polymerase II holoenzyme cyclin-like subunit [Icmadophila ericetorum]|nr:RNA polymerase II holoenzyme cyclin-like subunit [Icmadophila ericetorum]